MDRIQPILPKAKGRKIVDNILELEITSLIRILPMYEIDTRALATGTESE